MKKLLGATALLASLAVPVSANAALEQLSNLFVFGDSLSDGGNSAIVTGGFVPPYPSNRYSNGPVAVEYLWQMYNPHDAPLTASLTGGTNYAIGGATTGSANYNSVNPRIPDDPNVPPGNLREPFDGKGNAWQLESFADQLGQGLMFNPATSLFVVWLFPNDVFYALTTGSLPGTVPGSPGGADVVSNGIANILTTVGTLAAAGAQHFLVPNMPDLGATPEFSGTFLEDPLRGLTALFNLNLKAQLDLLAAGLPWAEIVQFDTAAAFEKVRADPAAYGFDNATDRCFVAPGSQCADPDKYVFWDGAHPTTSMQQILAGQFRTALLPEPGTIVLVAFGLFGLAAARQRKLL